MIWKLNYQAYFLFPVGGRSVCHSYDDVKWSFKYFLFIANDAVITVMVFDEILYE